MIQGKDYEETVRLTASRLGCSEEMAAWIVSIETGHSTGDVRYVDRDGNPLPPDQDPRRQRMSAARYLKADINR